MIETSLYQARKATPNDILEGDYDLFVIGLNNESRSTVILEMLRSNFKFKKRILFQSQILPDELSEITRDFTNFNVINVINSFPFDRIEQYKQVINSIEPKSGKVAIDMTGLQVFDLYIILQVLKREYANVDITIFYAEPYNYYYRKYLFNNYEYSLGELNVIEVPGYIGKFDRTKDNIMILILGFEGRVSRHIYLHDEPNKVIAINGFPSSIQKYKDISVINNGILREVNYEKLYYSDATNPFELYNTLNKITREYGEANYSIVPLGSKPMALGAGLFQIHNQTMKIKYPMAESYNYNKIKNISDVIWKYSIKI